eukprot:3656599-Amphidinium_carterae.1
MHHHLIGLKNKVTSLEDEMQSTVAALYSAGAVRTGSAAGSDVGGVVLPDERLKVTAMGSQAATKGISFRYCL